MINTSQPAPHTDAARLDDRPLIYINGEWLPKSRAMVSVFDHGLLYGDGVFEGIRAYNGRVFRLREHLRRLRDSGHAILLDMPMSLEALEDATLETLRRNNLRDGYIRLIVTRGVGDLGLDPRKCCEGATVIIIADQIQLYPEKFYTEGLEVITVATRRNIPDALSPAIKSLNYLNNILAKIEVVRAGLQEGIMLNAQGLVSEATGDNIFIIRDGRLITPPVSDGILEGITRDAVIMLAREMGIDTAETSFTTTALYACDECFLTGTAAEVIPVVKIDGRVIGAGVPGPMTLRLIQRFRDHARESGVPIYTE